MIRLPHNVVLSKPNYVVLTLVKPIEQGDRRMRSRNVYCLPLLLSVLFLASSIHAQDSLNVQLLGTLYGKYDNTRGIAIEGEHAFLATGNTGLRIIDISNPVEPVEIGANLASNRAVDVDVDGNYAYVADSVEGLWIIDIEDPGSPEEISFFSTPSGLYEVIVRDNIAFVRIRGSGLRIIDVSDPMNPVNIGIVNTPGYAYDIAIEGDYAYVADGSFGLRIIDISDPHEAVEIGFSQEYFASNVAVQGDYAYISAYEDGLLIINVSDPTNPVEVGAYVNDNLSVQGVAVFGNYVGIITIGDGLFIFDVSDPTDPIPVGHHEVPWGGVEVTYANGLCFVSSSHTGLHIFDVSIPSEPIEIGVCDTPDFSEDVAVSDGLAYIAQRSAGLRIVDVSDPSHPVELSSVDTPGSAQGVEVVGGYAVIADGPGGLRIIDIHDPLSPIEIGSHNAPNNAVNVAVGGQYAYVADSDKIRIFDLSNPSEPRQIAIIGTVWDQWDVKDVDVEGDYLYVAEERHDGLLVIDVSDPSEPELVGNGSNNLPVALAVRGSYVFAISLDYDEGDSYLDILDVSDPTAPDMVGWMNFPLWATDVTVEGNIAYIAATGGVRVIDVEDPTSPVEIGYYAAASSGGSTGITTENGLTYVTQYYQFQIFAEDTGNHVGNYSEERNHQAFSLDPVYPNPFNSATTVRYSLTQPGEVRVTVFDLLGREVASLYDGLSQPGEHTLPFNASNYPSGTYFLQLDTGNQ
ncbi:MAG TPA: T9SS type A sorting domain-containing protein, partial [Bacteroidetes bacterium]|nr:T9SS type A sorting domain-containing protein [Bacteroidota bacterium]HEX04335.1 T9SS type A sorting domain-containing protein [Bacteroidota bacterium]